MNIFKKFQSKDKVYCFDLFTAPFCRNKYGRRYVSYTTSRYVVYTNNDDQKMEEVSLSLKELFKKKRVITLIVIHVPFQNGIFYKEKEIARLEWANIRSMRSLSKALDTLMANAILKEV
jgi:hypothetical protein